MMTKPATIPFESFEIGQERSFGAYEVSKAEILEFARKYDPQFFHVDPEAAKDSLFGGLCASGWHTGAMMMSMMVADMQKVGSSLGSPGVDELRWRKPVFPGDILSVQTKVIDKIPSKSRPEIGVVVHEITVVNQSGTPVMTFISKGMYPRT